MAPPNTLAWSMFNIPTPQMQQFQYPWEGQANMAQQMAAWPSPALAPTATTSAVSAAAAPATALTAGMAAGTGTAAPVTPAVGNQINPTAIARSGAPGGIAKPSYLTKPVSEWTGADHEAYNKANAPNQTMSNVSMGVQAANSLLNMGLGIYSMWNANREFDFQKGMAESNLANSIKSYNNQLEDKIKSRYTADQYVQNQKEIDHQIEDKQAKR